MLCKVSSFNDSLNSLVQGLSALTASAENPSILPRGENHFPGRRIYLDFDLEFNKHHLHYIFLSVLEVNAFGEKDVLFGRLFSSRGRGEMGKTVRRRQQALTVEGQQPAIIGYGCLGGNPLGASRACALLTSLWVSPEPGDWWRYNIRWPDPMKKDNTVFQMLLPLGPGRGYKSCLTPSIKKSALPRVWLSESAVCTVNFVLS